jgi:hypothetical protein
MKMFTLKCVQTMHHSAPWTIDSLKPLDGFPSILWNPMIRYLIHKSSPLFHILIHINGVNAPILSLKNPSYYYPLTYVLVFLVVSFLLAFLPVIYMRSSSPNRVTCPFHLILLDWFILIILSEKYKSWSFTLCSVLKSSRHLISLLFKYSSQHPVLKHPDSMFLLQLEIKFHIHTEPQAKL